MTPLATRTRERGYDVANLFTSRFLAELTLSERQAAKFTRSHREGQRFDSP